VQDQADQQQMLDMTINKLAKMKGASRSQSGAWPQHPQCQRPDGDEDGTAGGDFPTVAHKLKFPKFDRSDDPLPLLNRCERYFHMRHTPEHQLVAFATIHLLDDTQLWFHRTELNGGCPTWPQFVQLVNTRFGLPLTDSPIGELTIVRIDGQRGEG
jgi:hypothetical protein